MSCSSEIMVDLRELCNGAKYAEASIVNQNIDPPVNGLCVMYLLCYAGLGLRHIHFDDLAAGALDCCYCITGSSCVPHRSDYFVAGLQDTEAEDETKATRGPGDKPDWMRHDDLSCVGVLRIVYMPFQMESLQRNQLPKEPWRLAGV